jgi:CBS domain containing-hemolysin-like protein
LKKNSFLKKLLTKNNDTEDKGLRDLNLNLEKQDMIRGVVELSDRSVKEAMIPRIDAVFLSIDTPPKDLVEQVTDSGHSRFPVFKDSIDNVVGVLYSKDLLRFLFKNEDIKIEDIVRKPFFVPESKKLDSLLREMKRKRIHIAVSVDEYGGVSGIICMEDIIEEIVGDIQDEFDHEREDILKIGEGIYLCDARLDIEDMNEMLGTEISDEEFDTLGGYVFDLFGKIPVKYEKVTDSNMDFIIQDMDNHKIKTVKIVVRSQENEDEKAAG